METIVVTQECYDCGCKFDIMYLQDGTYEYIDDCCDCESPFSPISGQPSISQWLESIRH